MNRFCLDSRYRRAVLAALCALVVLAARPGAAWAQEGAGAGDEAMSAADFDKQSLALRTALHYDPMLEAPLRTLLQHYAKANRTDELVSLYRAHVAQYPQDAGARAVLIRMLRDLRKPEASEAAMAAVQALPQDPLVAYLAFEDYEARSDPRALDELSRAISLQPQPARRRAWVEKLVPKAIEEGRQDLAEKHLRELAEDPAATPEVLVSLARQMTKYRLPKLALETLKRAAALNKSPEVAVEIELESADAEAAAGEAAAASGRLDALLGKVAPDYWRRPEIVVKRVALIDSDAEREAMLQKARAAYAENPTGEAAALDLAELLSACGLRREALDTLLQASEKIPHSARIAERTLALLDRLGDSHRAEEYLRARLKVSPGSPDLVYRLVKALYATGKKDEAKAEFEKFATGLSTADKLNRLLELARHLRRMSQPADAAELFEQAVALAPERLDVRRELAEVLVALGDRPAARKLFKDGEAAEGAAENFLDMAQFMVAQGLLAEARAAAEKRLAESPGNFDLRLLLIEIYGKIGAQRSGEEAITGARALADTPARYSRWLDTAAMFHELFDTAEPFFDAEHLRLMGADPEWTPELAEKFLAFCSAADRGDLREKVADYLREQIGSPTLPEDLRPVLRRLLVESLGSSPEHAAEIQSQLQILAQEDKEKGDAYKLRLALTMHQPESGRTDQARALLEEADPSRVEDAELLGGMHLIYLDYGMPEKALAALARQVELEPENKAAWADWITLLAALGDEENLRTALRRLTAGAGKLELSEDTHELIRGHLVDSYWRSIARLIADGGDGTQAEALAMLDAVERAKQLGEERLWVLWTRAFLYSRLGQNAARDEALAELTAAANVLSPRLDPDAAATATAPPTVPVPDADPDVAEAGAVAGSAAPSGRDPSAGQPVKIRFPDGLALSLDAAAQVLTDPPVAPPHADADNGPMAPLGVRWAFEVASGAAIAQVLPLGGGERVFILDIQGNASVLDAASGKVLWEDQVTKPIPTGRRRTSGGRSIRTVGGVRQIMHTGGASQGYRLPAQAAATGDGSTIIVPTYAGTLRAFSAAEGDLLWESEIAPPEGLPADRVRGQLGGLMPSVFAEGGRAIAYEPASGVACAFEGKTGKLVWSATVVEEGSAAGMNLHALNTGASLSGGYLLVYGRKAAILRADDGRLVWEFAPTSARRFPLDIKTVDDLVDQGDWWGMPVLGGSGSASTPWSGLNAGSYSSPFGRPQSMAHLGGNTSYRTSNARQFVGQPGALLAPAALWAQEATAGNFSRAELRGRRLLLMGNGSAPVQSLSLDFPLAARPIGVYGIFAGWAGGKFVTVQNRQSSIFNASTGAGNTVELDPIASPEKRSDGAVAPVGLLQATVAGARVYFSGPRGILCVNAHTGSEIFRAPWPEAAVEFAGDSDWVGGGSEERPGDETATPGGQTPVQAISRSGGQQGGSGLSTNWYGYTNNDYAGPCQPLLNTAANGILYAIATPGRLIALGAEDGGAE